MSWLHTHFVLPLAEPERHAGLPKRLRAIRRFEQKPESAQRQEQQDRLQRILQHAYETVPLYRRRFDEAGFRPSDAKAGEPLPLPTLTLDHLRSAGTDILSNRFSREELRTAPTSGTTGAPVTFHRNIEALRDKTALTLQLRAWAGFHAGDSVMMLWGYHRDLTPQSSWRWRLYDETIMRRISCPSGILNEEILDRYRARYEERRPKVLYCYATVLAAFAAHLQKHGFRHRPKVLIATAELLSDANRALIESVFGIPVYDLYGSRDIGMIAAECPEHAGVHFHPWSSYVEFEPIGDTAEGPTYRLIVTDLLNYGQPFIRYDTGDYVTLPDSKCRCGRWFPQARKILGRAGDGIVLADGSILTTMTVEDCIEEARHRLPSVVQLDLIQIAQKTDGHLNLRYVVKDGSPPVENELQAIRDEIEAAANQRFPWTTEQVAEIPRERSGKIRMCISELSRAHKIPQDPSTGSQRSALVG